MKRVRLLPRLLTDRPRKICKAVFPGWKPHVLCELNYQHVGLHKATHPLNSNDTLSWGMEFSP